MYEKDVNHLNMVANDLEQVLPSSFKYGIAVISVYVSFV